VQVGTPGALYRQPGNEFVARFVGESNLIDARVLRVEGDVAVLRQLGGADDALVFEARHAGTPPEAGREVKVLVRPERVALVAPGSPGALAATVESSVFLGEILRIDAVLRGGGGGGEGGRVQLRCLDPRDGRLPVAGEAVHLAWQAGDAWVLA
jgi:putative spermidine/putrescine transport system ATP-binding protein